MRYINRIAVALIIATTIFFNASLGRETTVSETEPDEADVPPDLLAPETYEIPALSDASKVIADDVAERERLRQAERQRIKDEEAARISEAERLAALEDEREAVRERKAKAVKLASNPTEPSRGNVEQLGAGQAFTATFYTAFCDTGCTGVTATGLDVSNTIYTPDGLRVVAVDPSQIPLGSIVQVSLADGTVFNAEAADTGGAIKGRIIDVLVADTNEAQRLGRQDIRIHIIREGR